MPRQKRSTLPDVFQLPTPLPASSPDDAAVWCQHPGEEFFTPEELVQIGVFLDLTGRELEALALLLAGHTHLGIANRMHKGDRQRIRESTARSYLDRVYRNARVDDSLALVLRVMRIHRFLHSTVKKNRTGPGCRR